MIFWEPHNSQGLWYTLGLITNEHIINHLMPELIPLSNAACQNFLPGILNFIAYS